MKNVELEFTNTDARPKVETVNVDPASVATICRWYGGFFSGDRYTIKVDGILVPKDQNGEIV